MCVLCPMYSVRDIAMSDAACTCQGNRTTSSGDTTTNGEDCDGEWMWFTEKLSSLEIRVDGSCRHVLRTRAEAESISCRLGDAVMMRSLPQCFLKTFNSSAITS